MTYLEVLLWFILPPALLLAVWGLGGLGRYGVRGRVSVPAVAAIAFLYAAPWDNYLVWRGVWDTPEGRTLGRIFFVPVEEYAFFVLQPVLTGMWFGVVLRRWSLRPRATEARGSLPGAAFWLVAALFGSLLWTRPGSLYLGALLAWTSVALLCMSLYRGAWLGRNRGVLAAAVLPPTLYLWAVDRIALSEGAWVLSPRHLVGLELFGIPLEEALFFLLTNILVAVGMGLFLEPALGRSVDTLHQGASSV